MGKFEKGNKGGGRKGYHYEKAMQVLIDNGFHIVNKAITKKGTDLNEKEKIQIAVKVVEKILGKNIDITSGGEKLNNYDEGQIRQIAKEVCADGGSESQR